MRMAVKVETGGLWSTSPVLAAERPKSAAGGVKTLPDPTALRTGVSNPKVRTGPMPAGHRAPALRTGDVLREGGSMDEWTKKPEGGYVPVPAWAIVSVWNGYRQGKLRFGDVRLWLAAFEVRARRCRVRRGCRPRWEPAELAGVAGLRNLGRASTGLRRLEGVGLLTWGSSGAVTPTGEPASMGEAGLTADQRNQLRNDRRMVPVPRRTLRFLCSTTRPVLLATALGHLLRCVYWRRRGVSPRGLCKAGWVARLFGVDARNVKAARGCLESLGLLRREPTPQHVLNRWGQAVVWNMAWDPRESPPQTTSGRRGTPPPKRTGISLRELRNQEPRPARRGVFGHALGRVERGDLADPGRLEELHARASAAGLVGEGLAGKLRVFAAAARARRVGSINPVGLFAAIVTRGLWGHLSGIDEEGGRRLQRSGGAATERRARTPNAPPVSVAQVVAGLMRSLPGSGQREVSSSGQSGAASTACGSGPSPTRRPSIPSRQDGPCAEASSTKNLPSCSM